MMYIHTYETENYVSSDKARRYVAAFTLQEGMLQPMTEWCYKTFGKPGYLHLTDQTRWYNHICYGEIIFSREEDLGLFVLRWS